MLIRSLGAGSTSPLQQGGVMQFCLRCKRVNQVLGGQQRITLGSGKGNNYEEARAGCASSLDEIGGPGGGSWTRLTGVWPSNGMAPSVPLGPRSACCPIATVAQARGSTVQPRSCPTGQQLSHKPNQVRAHVHAHGADQHSAAQLPLSSCPCVPPLQARPQLASPNSS